MMNRDRRCGMCKHWGKDNDTEVYRGCQAVIHDKSGSTNKDMADYDSDDDWDRETREEIAAIRKHHLAVVVDGSNYFAALKTQSDFSCALFSPATTIEGPK